MSGTEATREVSAVRLGDDLTHIQRIKAITAGSLGNLIEWYDFYVYAFTALYFASSFFPQGDRTAQLINVAAIYAAGFFIRPIGGWYFGRYADRHGRKAAMILSILLMGAGSLLIAALPTYAAVGALAPALLLLARLMQGFSTGGQYGTAATYLSEVATTGRRGFYASFHFVTLLGGQLGALLVLLILQNVLSEADIRAWGWRIPFAFGAVLALSFLLLRHAMHETAVGEKPKDAGTLRALIKHPGALFIVVSLTASGAICLYAFTTYMQKFLVNTAGMDVKTASSIMTGSLVVFICLQPIIGALSDKIGRRTCLLIFTGVMTVLAVPLLSALAEVETAFMAFLLVVASVTILSFYTSVSGLFKAELFPAHVRALGVNIAHSVSAAVFGGTVEYVALVAKQGGHENYFYWYVAGMCALTFIVALRMKETRHTNMRS